MKILPKFVERNLSNVTPEFDEAARAKSLVAEIAGHCWSGKGDMIDRVFDAIRHLFPKSNWTRRRVRALWHRETAGVRWREMSELEFAAGVARTKRTEQEKARKAHDDFIGRLGAKLDGLAIQDEAHRRAYILALRGMASGSADPKSRTAAQQSSGRTDQRSTGEGL